MRSLWLILVAACSFRAGAPLASQDDGSPASGDARAVDAATHDAIAIDAMAMPDASRSTGSDAGPAGPIVVACYAQGSPSATCSAPDHCCFTNFDAYHDGSCATTACAWGTITCDGPEDCSSGEYCCAHAIRDPDFGTIGYTVACQATACGTPPLDQELCQTSATCSHGTCASALGIDNDLPRALQICQ